MLQLHVLINKYNVKKKKEFVSHVYIYISGSLSDPSLDEHVFRENL